MCEPIGCVRSVTPWGRASGRVSGRVSDRGARAFSLVELSVTVAIVGIVAALATPNVTSMVQARKASIEVDKVESRIKKARDDARARLRCIRVQRGPSLNQLTISEMVAAPSGCGATAASSTTETFDARAVEITTALDITFTRSGSVSGAGADPTFTITGKRDDGSTRPQTYQVFRLLGLVRRL